MKQWCIPTPSARFVAKMEDVLAVYQRPYDPQRPVVCLDEVPKALRSTPRGQLPPGPEQVAREDYEYARHGNCALFVAVEPLRGYRRVWVHERRTKLDCAQVLRALVDELYPSAERIVLVTDNLNIHDPSCLYECFEPTVARRIAAKLEWHFTPEHGSWLNIAECELSVLQRQCLKARMADIQTVRHQVAAWQDVRNQQQVTIDWHFSDADARLKLKRLYPVIHPQQSA